MLHDTTALGRTTPAPRAADTYRHTRKEGRSLVSSRSAPGALRSFLFLSRAHRSMVLSVSRSLFLCLAVGREPVRAVHAHRRRSSEQLQRNVHNCGAEQCARRCSALGLGYDSKFSLPCGVLMAGNAAGFSGLELPSSSSIFVASLPLARRSRTFSLFARAERVCTYPPVASVARKARKGAAPLERKGKRRKGGVPGEGVGEGE